MNLRDLLADWEDQDFAAFCVGVALGLWEHGEGCGTFRRVKHIFWTNNPLGEALYGMLRTLTDEGFLLEDDEETRYRWKGDADG